MSGAKRRLPGGASGTTCLFVIKSNYGAISPCVSVPERALLEMLCNVGKHQSVEEARHLAENLRNPSPDVLATLLVHCTRIKVVRLVHLRR
jgi:hypothetical protein